MNRITKLDYYGRGITYISDKITFVKNALPEEEVDIKIILEKKKYNEAEVIKYLKISDKRIKPKCPYFNICGGCHLMHLKYIDTLKFKENKIKELFLHNKLEYKDFEVIKNENEFNYRNKISLKVVNKEIGFYEEKTHKLIKIDYCYVAKESINKTIKLLNKLDIIDGNITIRSNYNDEILLIISTKDKIKFNKDDFESIKFVGVVLNNKTIYGDNYFYERLNGFLFKVSFDAFFQVNHYIVSKLFDILKNNIDEKSKVLDLYSGVGTLGIVASKGCSKVISIEIIKNAVLDNLFNKKLNKQNNIEVLLGDASKIINKINIDFDNIIIDPPRSGLSNNEIDIILNSNASKIIYISCNPDTLVRDLKRITSKYIVSKLYALDMFSYSYHVECVCVLKRR